MYFEINENGKIMICAETMVKPGMIRLDPPAGFIPDEMSDWVISGGEFIYQPKEDTEPEAPTQEERLTALEEENRYLKEALDLLLSGETEVQDG